MYNYSHPEEKYQVQKVMRHRYRHPQALLDIRFFDGEEYHDVFNTAYNSENGCNLDTETDDPRYDEFSQVAFEVTEIIKDGLCRYNEFLTVGYCDFPVLTTNVETDEIVYSAETDLLRR